MRAGAGVQLRSLVGPLTPASRTHTHSSRGTSVLSASLLPGAEVAGWVSRRLAWSAVSTVLRRQVRGFSIPLQYLARYISPLAVVLPPCRAARLTAWCDGQLDELGWGLLLASALVAAKLLCSSPHGPAAEASDRRTATTAAAGAAGGGGEGGAYELVAGGADAQEGVGRGSAVPPDASEAAPLVPSGAAGRMQRSNTSRDLGEGYDELGEAAPTAPIGRLNLSAEPEDITDSYGPGASFALVIFVVQAISR